MREGAPTILKAGFLFRCSPDPEFQKWCWMTQAHPNVHLHLAVPHGIQSARRPRGKTRTASIHQPMVGGREPRLLDYFKRSTNLRLIKSYDGAHCQSSSENHPWISVEIPPSLCVVRVSGISGSGAA